MMKTIASGIPPYVTSWFESLEPLSIAQAAPEPSRAGVFSTDMVAGFLSKGNLASPRVGRLANPVTEVFRKAHKRGVRHFLLFQDAHHPGAPEFDAFPPHCVQGTEESVTIPGLQALPFSDSFIVIGKNSLSQAIGTGFDKWLDDHSSVNVALVVGNCTDLCVYQLAMHLRMRANAFDYRDYHVIVPANAVDTYDISEETAQQVGSLAHPGDFFHQVFLYHMALNGIRVVRELT